MADTRRFEHVVLATWQRVREELGRKGLSLPEEFGGTLELYGVRLRISYDTAAQAIDLAILSHPPFIGEDLIWRYIDQAVTPHLPPARPE